MADNGHKAGVQAITRPQRFRGSGPILLLAALFVIASFLAWYFTWFGRSLSDQDISSYLDDEKHPRHVQHALFQIELRMEKGDASVARWYPRIISLSKSSETEFRLTVSWLMGFDNRSQEFHEALLQLLHDPEPIVRRNAALALVRFGDNSGHEELQSVLRTYVVTASVDGVVQSTLKEGAGVSRGTLLARIEQPNGTVTELRSPLPGSIKRIVAADQPKVSSGSEVVQLDSDEQSVWETLRGLALIGSSEDLALIGKYKTHGSSRKIREQAALTLNAIQNRSESKDIKP
ncbi:MAG: HEAT repeat domain-containing protein [Pyrinomonadaceae bacterium]